ncbi:unnamed protein product, partial [Amoebophrya sp. A25]
DTTQIIQVVEDQELQQLHVHDDENPARLASSVVVVPPVLPAPPVPQWRLELPFAMYSLFQIMKVNDIKTVNLVNVLVAASTSSSSESSRSTTATTEKSLDNQFPDIEFTIAQFFGSYLRKEKMDIILEKKKAENDQIGGNITAEQDTEEEEDVLLDKRGDLKFHSQEEIVSEEVNGGSFSEGELLRYRVLLPTVIVQQVDALPKNAAIEINIIRSGRELPAG